MPGANEPLIAADDEIPLPPEELWPDLDNTRQAEPTAAPASEKPRRPAADLAFTRSRSTAIPLDFPFEWDGRVIDTVTVRRLNTAEVGAAVATVSADEFDLVDVYAVMTGLPATVLRGLDGADGERVTGVAYDFLPPVLRIFG